MTDLLKAAAAVLAMCESIGDFRNGVTDPTGSIDEGEVRAGELLEELRAALASPPVAVQEDAQPIALEALELVAMQPATRGVYLLDQQDMDFVKRAVKALKEQA